MMTSDQLLLRLADLLRGAAGTDPSGYSASRVDAIVKAAQPAIAALAAQVVELGRRVDVLAAAERIRLAQLEFTSRTNFAKYIVKSTVDLRSNSDA
jgi:hypothetical protein